jgi:hypothetical protein
VASLPEDITRTIVNDFIGATEMEKRIAELEEENKRYHSALTNMFDSDDEIYQMLPNNNAFDITYANKLCAWCYKLCKEEDLCDGYCAYTCERCLPEEHCSEGSRHNAKDGKCRLCARFD